MSQQALRLCLVGSGISHSPSAVMHQAAMQSTGVEGTYVLRDLAPDDIDTFVAELRQGRYTGCNVTAPYKAVMAERCDLLEGDAESLGVVNTITVRGGRLLGATTDADGFELALTRPHRRATRCGRVRAPRHWSSARAVPRRRWHSP
jgi:shikimate dehydrogenase